MHRQKRGVILQIGSGLAYQSVPLESAYSASKAAIRSFTDSLREKLIREGSGIAVAMLHLPAVNTPHSDVVLNRPAPDPEPVPPVYQPEMIAQATVYAALHSKADPWRRPNGHPPTTSTLPAPVTEAPMARSLTAPNPSRFRALWTHTHSVVFALLGLSAAVLAFGPLRRWAREHTRLLLRSQ
jgi:NAD(P)-dependent dehydrogenase (short-subunit alcohol dehydrogenase family)